MKKTTRKKELNLRFEHPEKNYLKILILLIKNSKKNYTVFFPSGV